MFKKFAFILILGLSISQSYAAGEGKEIHPAEQAPEDGIDRISELAPAIKAEVLNRYLTPKERMRLALTCKTQLKDASSIPGYCYIRPKKFMDKCRDFTAKCIILGCKAFKYPIHNGEEVRPVVSNIANGAALITAAAIITHGILTPPNPNTLYTLGCKTSEECSEKYIGSHFGVAICFGACVSYVPSAAAAIADRIQKAHEDDIQCRDEARLVRSAPAN